MKNSGRPRVAVIGSGYVGTTLAASLAELDRDVTAIDIDPDIVDALNRGDAPIHEPGLPALIERHAGDRLTATTEYDVLPQVDIAFIAVQTPTNEDGSIDISAIRAAAEMAGAAIADLPPDERPIIVVKSTVTPAHLPAVRAAVRDGAGDDDVAIGMNPEFLREGTAVEDFEDPDKLVFGAADARTAELLERVYAPLIEATDATVITTDPETAAMIKYANNAFLAAKISLINDLGNICKTFDLDAYEVAEAIGTDERIGEQFLRSGVGFGGSCFPKDVNAIVRAAESAGYDPIVLTAALDLNAEQPARMLALLDKHVDVRDKRIAVLGLAFKPGTDDIRNSRAIPVIEGLQERGATVVAYDPVAVDNMREQFPDIDYAASAAAALDGAHGALVVTDWDEFATLDGAFDRMVDPVVIDGRRIVDPPAEITYEGLTW